MEVIGSVDRCDEFVIEGWITIQGEPDKKLCLDVCLDEMPIGQCIADRYREDLKLAGLAEGLCAFWFDMPSFITNGDLEKIRIRLNNSVLFLDMKKPEAEGDVAVVPVPRDGSSGLWIDRADWLDRLALKHRTNKISDDLSLSIFQFVRDGFFLMEKALSNDMVDRLNDAVELVWRRPPESSLASADEPLKKTPNGTPEKRVKLLIFTLIRRSRARRWAFLRSSIFLRRFSMIGRKLSATKPIGIVPDWVCIATQMCLVSASIKARLPDF